MKKFFIFLSLLIFSAPAFAVCPIDGGACKVSLSDWDGPTLQEKVIPNNLKNMQRSDVFQHDYVKPYNDGLINTAPGPSISPVGDSNYNSNCQFGVCLPGVGPSGPAIE